MEPYWMFISNIISNSKYSVMKRIKQFQGHQDYFMTDLLWTFVKVGWSSWSTDLFVGWSHIRFNETFSRTNSVRIQWIILCKPFCNQTIFLHFQKSRLEIWPWKKSPSPQSIQVDLFGQRSVNRPGPYCIDNCHWRDLRSAKIFDEKGLVVLSLRHA